MDRDDLAALVKAGTEGDEGAWNELVRRFAGLVTHVVHGYRLSPADAQDVGQLVWLRLVEHLVRQAEVGEDVTPQAQVDRERAEARGRCADPLDVLRRQAVDRVQERRRTGVPDEEVRLQAKPL